MQPRRPLRRQPSQPSHPRPAASPDAPTLPPPLPRRRAEQLTDAHIAALPVPRLQRAGLLFVWVINAKYQFTLDLFDQWGYE